MLKFICNLEKFDVTERGVKLVITPRAAENDMSEIARLITD